MATGDKKRAVMTDDINNSGSSYPVLGPTGDGSNVTAAFTPAASRTNISTGEKLSVIFGKIAKWFTDLGAAAFRAVDAAPTAGSTNLVESGGVKSILNNKQDTLATVVDTSPVTPSTGTSIPTGTQCSVKKYGNIINLSGVLQKTLVLNQWNELGVLDSQYWIGERTYFVFMNVTTDAPVNGDINSDGTIRVRPISSNSVAGTANIAFNVVYIKS